MTANVSIASLITTFNSLKLQNQDMGRGKLTVKLDNLDGQAWHQFSQQYNAQAQALMAKPSWRRIRSSISRH